MDKVTVQLTSAWPTDQGVRRPQEGLIEVSAEDAERIVETGCGTIVVDEEADPAPKAKAKAKPVDSE